MINLQHLQQFSQTEHIALILREVRKLPKERQDFLRKAIQDYCEVFDQINQALADAQKDVKP